MQAFMYASMFRSRRPENDAPLCGATYSKSKHSLLWIDYILLRDTLIKTPGKPKSHK